MTGPASGRRFAAATERAAAALPFGLSGRVPPSLIGYAVINGSTFALDVAILATLRGGLGWPLPVAVTVAYATAFGLSFVLNRRFNFRSHAPVGAQVSTYILIVAINYLVWILGAVDGLTALGVAYLLARVVAGACEAGYMYCALRWVVFRPGLTGALNPAARSDG